MPLWHLKQAQAAGRFQRTEVCKLRPDDGRQTPRAGLARLTVERTQTRRVWIGRACLGVFDNVRLYNKAVTAADIPQIMRGNLLRAWAPVPSRNADVDIEHATVLRFNAGNGSGAVVGYFSPPYMDRDNAHGGIGQSVPFSYDHRGLVRRAYSEISRTFETAQDFTRLGVTHLQFVGP